MQRIILIVGLTLALSGGCVHHGDVGVGYSYGYVAPEPSLYYVSPGVSVVAYQDYPVFYADNYYWRYDGGTWYRSNHYHGGWYVHYDVPVHVRGIHRPYSYARFQPGVGWSRTHTNRGYQSPYRAGYQGGVRDHRSGYTRQTPSYTNRGPAYSPPAARDHRTAPAPAPRHRAPDGRAGGVRDHRR
jgi:hypothetical protein